ncbi:hypothetical protein CPB83DRAFT_859583 [Crepidotus variabilis]|uniref:F-box domain-containing protein n=1 Tax=Crepidotus variabilis TaxID=179855 RepID=A0A9P6EAN6_9AGAR|nr:hypothetical protein CPB83DRAFT_859583 [Crepidotus variabilis]
MPMLIDVPTEIWRHIASFLETEELWAVRSENRTLWDEAWNRECRLFRVYFPVLDERGLHNMDQLRRPMIANRVREVLLNANKFLPQRSSLFRRILARPMSRRKFSLKIFGPKFTSQKMTDGLKAIISSFPNVSSLEIDISTASNRFCEWVIPVCVTALDSFILTLRSLSISVVPFSAITSLLDHHTFMNLENFSLHLFVSSTKNTPEGFAELLSGNIIPFIQRHTTTLRSLSLHPVYHPSYNIVPLLACLENIQNVRVFDFKSSNAPPCVSNSPR